MIIIQTIRLTASNLQGDVTDSVWVFFWCSIEASVAIIMVSLTAFRSLYGLNAASRQNTSHTTQRRGQDTLSRRFSFSESTLPLRKLFSAMSSSSVVGSNQRVQPPAEENRMATSRISGPVAVHDPSLGPRCPCAMCGNFTAEWNLQKELPELPPLALRARADAEAELQRERDDLMIRAIDWERTRRFERQRVTHPYGWA